MLKQFAGLAVVMVFVNLLIGAAALAGGIWIVVTVLRALKVIH